MKIKHLGVVWAVLAAAWCCQGARAGGGPENLILIVNQNSEGSKTVANHYARLRGLAPSNMVYLDYKGPLEACTATVFRDQILKPTLEQVDARKLGLQTDYLVYSTDLPWRVDVREDHADTTLSKQQSPHASTTGATFLWRHVVAKSLGLLAYDVNWYAPFDAKNLGNCAELSDFASQGFRGRYTWERGGIRGGDPKTGQAYLLSTMLGVTTGRGNTVDEVLAYLSRAASADATQPRGTFYYCRSNDVRSKTRHNCFPQAIAQLALSGGVGQEMRGDLPTGTQDILGITTGAANLDFQGAAVRTLPGAIIDNLTSTAGNLVSSGQQTPISEYLRAGCAGASGTVWEPYAIQAKFPLPSIHVHYRRGCSLAEAYYQSVSAPYQLLILGDPLCQPWAKPPKVGLSGVDPGGIVGEKMTVTASVTFSDGSSDGVRPPLCELFIDGRLRARAPARKPLTIDTSDLAEGWHELRMVAATPDAIESQGRAVLPFVVHRGDAPLPQLRLSATGAVDPGAEVRVTVDPPQTGEMRLMHNSLQMGVIAAGDAGFALRAGNLGRGLARLHAVGEEGLTTAPLWLEVR